MPIVSQVDSGVVSAGGFLSSGRLLYRVSLEGGDHPEVTPSIQSSKICHALRKRKTARGRSHVETGDNRVSRGGFEPPASSRPRRVCIAPKANRSGGNRRRPAPQSTGREPELPKVQIVAASRPDSA